jgi:hypothetical protein
MKSRGQLNGNPYVMAFQFPSWALTDKYREEFRKYPSKYREEYMPPKAFTVSPDWDPEELTTKASRVLPRTTRNRFKMRAQEASNPDTFKVERRGKFAEVEDAYLKPEMVDRMFAGAPIGYDEERQANLGALLLQLRPWRPSLL